MAVVHLWCLVLARSFPFKVCSFLLIVTNTVVSGVVISNKRGAVPIAEFIDSYICGLLLLVEGRSDFLVPWMTTGGNLGGL